jgi:hypothetical protein
MIEPTSTASLRVNVVLSWFEALAERLRSD